MNQTFALELIEYVFLIKIKKEYKLSLHALWLSWKSCIQTFILKGPFKISYGTVEIQYKDQRFKVNGQRLKEYNDSALITLKTIIILDNQTSKF